MLRPMADNSLKFLNSAIGLRLRTLTLACLMLLVIPTTSFGQKVGLVLSGGGAKGIAHVGVLKALEENNIPIDYIVGTSMGGIVGALYAAGYSPSEIEYLVSTEAFQAWATGKPEQNYTYNFASPEPNPSLLKLQISVDTALQARLTSNLVNDASLNFALAQLLSQPAARSNYDFDKLLVPYRCVAADIFTQQQVILRRGQLADAVRATLTVPLFFKPIRIEKRLLFDGGLYNNFPVDVARNDFKPDVIIGVNVSSKIYSEYPYDNDDFDLAHTLLYAMMSNSDSTALNGKDIYLQPELGSLTSLDFKNVEELFTAGYTEANAKMEQIKRKIDRRVSPEELAKKRDRFRSGFQPHTFQSIKIQGVKENQKAFVEKFFRSTEGTDSYTMQQVKTGYYRLAAIENFSSLYPTMRYDQANKHYDLFLDVKKESGLKLALGGVLASRPVDNIYAGLEYSLLGSQLYTFAGSFQTGRFYQAAQLRTRVDVPASLPYYVEPSFTYNNWNFLSTTGFLLERNKIPFIEQADRSYALDLGFTNTYKGKLVLSTAFTQNIDRYSNRLDILSSDTLDRTDLEAFTVAGIFRRGSLNRKQYASSGRMFTASARFVSATEKYSPGSTATITEKSSIEHEWFYGRLLFEDFFGENKHKFGYRLEGVLSTQPFFSNYRSTLTSAPAFHPLSDSKTLFLDRFRAHQFVAGGLQYIYLVTPRLELRTEGYVFQPYKPILQNEEQQAYYGDTFGGTGLAATAAVVYHGVLGPVALNLNYYNDESKNWGVLFHLGFLLFQNRALE
ncbi:MAG: patatin-like phospholipase family protein [Hymenobacteraceae bacterium]|nr:patatin-like phospholipase family protein [Hymenobacteraceae bacterium]